jgi:hypothetical protein
MVVFGLQGFDRQNFVTTGEPDENSFAAIGHLKRRIDCAPIIVSLSFGFA